MSSIKPNEKIEEIWKDIRDYEGLYQVSNLGNVRGLCSRWGERSKSRPISKHITNKGYYRVSLSKNNKHKEFMVHRLVMNAFNPPTNIDLEINHKNYLRTDNRLENLEWVTHTENVRYSCAKKVLQYDLQSNFIKEWESLSDIERELKINHWQVHACIKGKKKTCHGYIWKYKEE